MTTEALGHKGLKCCSHSRGGHDKSGGADMHLHKKKGNKGR